MKKIVLSLSFGLLSILCIAQNGLEKIIVEKYYITNKSDSLKADSIALDNGGTKGTLPVGSVTYRLYVDMLPRYGFIDVYAVDNHELRIETSTSFYNNEDRGAITPDYTFVQAKSNTVLLDSWITVGLACQDYFGILKSKDNGVSTLNVTNGFLTNTDTAAGIPLTTQDGIFTTKNWQTPSIQTVGINLSSIDASNSVSATGQVISSMNGLWCSMGETFGIDTVSNMILIGQFTTDGDFSYKLNVCIQAPNDSLEYYVVDNPIVDDTHNEKVNSTLSGFYKALPKDKTQISNIISDDLVSVYPNPVKDFITINTSKQSFNSKNRIRIYDVVGKMVLEEQTNSNIEKVNISSFSSGVYYVEVLNDNFMSTHKIIKK